jgi:hypothetical protein
MTVLSFAQAQTVRSRIDAQNAQRAAAMRAMAGAPVRSQRPARAVRDARGRFVKRSADLQQVAA